MKPRSRAPTRAAPGVPSPPGQSVLSATSGVWPYPKWIAHRGAGRLAPENTLAAFRVGAGHGYRAFECDVKLSADGVPFLMHDADLQRTSSGQGAAGEFTWSELSRLDAGSWHSRGYAGEPLASLDAMAAYCIGNGYLLNVEIKPSPGTDAQTGRTVAADVERLWTDRQPAPLLSSFSVEALRQVRDVAPRLPRALLLDRLADGWLEQAMALGCMAVVFHYPLIDAGVVYQLQARGLRSLAYTVNDPAEVHRLCALGVDGLITDAVDRFSPADPGGE